MDQGSRRSRERPADDTEDRRRAVVRAWLCPGAGFAIVGRPWLAGITYLTVLFSVLALGWVVIEPGLAAGWTAGLLFGVAIVFWVAELIAVPRAAIRTSAPGLLVRGYLVAVVVCWLTFSGAAGAFLLSIGSTVVGGNGMAPTLGDGERAIYHKRVGVDDLRRGHVVVFHTSARSAWQPGAIVVGRVAAGPGDRIAIRGGQYLVNGEPGPLIGGEWKQQPVVAVPAAPGELVVPDECYFMVQDNPTVGSYDSRMLSWAERKDIVSGRIWYLRPNRFLSRVE